MLPQLYQKELLFRSHDQMGHQGVDKVYNRIQKRFEWPGLKKACEKWIAACLSCQQAKDPRKLRFPLQSIESSGFNEVVQIDHQKICMTATGYNQVLVMIDHFTKYAEAAPCMTASAEETCDHLINVWISEAWLPHHVPIGQWQSIRGRSHEGVDEEVAGSAGPLDHLSPANEWPSREAKSHTGIHAESLLLALHG